MIFINELTSGTEVRLIVRLIYRKKYQCQSEIIPKLYVYNQFIARHRRIALILYLAKA